MKAYLAVPFVEKDEAKRLGAKWDASVKKWYAPHMESVLLEKWKINTDPVALVGEDRSYGGNKLFIDLIPTTCWFTNVRSCVHPKDWDRLRNHVYERVNYICECCGIDTQKSNVVLEAHERWDYNEETYTQKLVRIVALCHDCHQTTHIGLAEIKGHGEEAKEHLKKVRGFTEEEFLQHKTKAFETWCERSCVSWNLDLSLITSNNINLSCIIPKKDERITSTTCKPIQHQNQFFVKPLEEPPKIERHYPTKLHPKSYSMRYTKYTFEEYNEVIKNVDLLREYEKWKNGINYNTNRKIKIGGKIHTDLKQKFMINYGHTLFEDLKDINALEYLQESEKINAEIVIENKRIKDYNTAVEKVIENIKALTKWNDFIEFEGKRYGIPNKILNKIHIENDCFGEMVFYMKKEKECRGCRDGVMFNGSYTCSCFMQDINKCSKCGFLEGNEL